MITLHVFGNMFPGGVGETKDMRVQWALEEMGLPYRVRTWDYLGGETKGEAFAALSPFGQIPVMEHDGQALTETAAILARLAEISGRLVPPGPGGRAEALQWCVAAMATVAPAVSMTALFDAGLMGADPAARSFLAGLSHRWLAALERRLEGRAWILGQDFTIADIAMAGVLREARHGELMDAHPRVRGVFERAFARPAWRRTLALTAERMGVAVEAIA